MYECVSASMHVCHTHDKPCFFVWPPDNGFGELETLGPSEQLSFIRLARRSSRRDTGRLGNAVTTSKKGRKVRLKHILKRREAEEAQQAHFTARIISACVCVASS